MNSDCGGLGEDKVVEWSFVRLWYRWESVAMIAGAGLEEIRKSRGQGINGRTTCNSYTPQINTIMALGVAGVPALKPLSVIDPSSNNIDGAGLPLAQSKGPGGLNYASLASTVRFGSDYPSHQRLFLLPSLFSWITLFDALAYPRLLCIE